MEEQFKLLFQEIKSVLKDSGFNTSGRTFNKIFSSGTIQVVNIQLGQRSLQGLFTINLGIYTKQNSSDTKFISESKCQLRQRIGFVSGQKDVWWTQTNLTDDDRSNILQALKKGLEWLDKNSVSKNGPPPVLNWVKAQEP